MWISTVISTGCCLLLLPTVLRWTLFNSDVCRHCSPPRRSWSKRCESAKFVASAVPCFELCEPRRCSSTARMLRSSCGCIERKEWVNVAHTHDGESWVRGKSRQTLDPAICAHLLQVFQPRTACQSLLCGGVLLRLRLRRRGKHGGDVHRGSLFHQAGVGACPGLSLRQQTYLGQGLLEADDGCLECLRVCLCICQRCLRSREISRHGSHLALARLQLMAVVSERAIQLRSHLHPFMKDIYFRTSI